MQLTRVPPQTFPRCAVADSVEQACAGLVADLYSREALPSIYLLVDGRLRCQAARGYFQVVDGFYPGTGVIGSVVASGRPRIVTDVTGLSEFIAAIPGLVAEACVPIRVHGAVVGAVNVESTTSLPEDIEARLGQAAAYLGARIEQLGGMPPVPLSQRLARIAVDIAGLTGTQAIIERAVSGAIEISAMSTGALSRIDGNGRWSISYVTGPLAAGLGHWTQEEHSVIASWGAPGTSSHFPGGASVPTEYGFLRRAGVQAIAVQPLFRLDSMVGLLITADARPVEHDPTVGAATELLAAQVTASLGMAEAIAELSVRAAQDPLTGLRNTGSFAEDMEREQRGAACLLIDIDHFKAVNDTYGHPVGDQLLCDLARQLSRHLRERDVLYRIGGDEFAAILPDTDLDDAARIALRLVEAARQVRTTVSIGLSIIGKDGVGSARLSADRALYQAKARGRDRVQIGRS